jgi:hypothetical protein
VILWHLGVAALITYVTLGRRRIDYRFVLAGAIAPDLLEGLLGLLGLQSPAGRGLSHSLAAVTAVAVGVIVVFRGRRRLAVFGLPVGWLSHLVGDGMWQAPTTFLWPAFGTRFASSPQAPYSWALFLDPSRHVWTWAGEVAGLVILAWFWVAFRMGEDGRLRSFWKDGYLRP